MQRYSSVLNDDQFHEPYIQKCNKNNNNIKSGITNQISCGKKYYKQKQIANADSK